MTDATLDMAEKKQVPDVGGLIATAFNDVTIPMFTTVLQPLDDTLIQRGQGKGLKLYDEIERDTHAFSVLQKRKHQLIAREWIVEPASEDAIDVKAADFVRDVLEHLYFSDPSEELPEQKLSGFDQLCLEMGDATLKGYAIAETVWTRDGAHIRPERIVSHEQRRFTFDHDWKPRLLTRAAMMDGIELPGRKFIVHRFGVKGNNPFGLGLGSRLFWAVLFKREGVAFWLKYLEKFAAPTPVGKHPLGMLPADQNKILQSLEGLNNRQAIVVPMGTELDLIEAKRAGQAGYEQWCRYWDEQISICVLGETLSTVVQGQGSRAAAETHAEQLEKLVDADGDLTSATLDSSLVRWLTVYNYPGARPPRVYRPRPANESAEEDIAEKRAKRRVSDLDSLKRLREEGFEPKDKQTWAERAFDEELVEVKRETSNDGSQPSNPPIDPADDEGASEFAEGKPLTPASLVTATERALAPTYTQWIDGIARALEGNDLAAVDQALLSLSANRRYGSFAETLGDALALAELLGRSDVQDEIGEAIDAAEPIWGGVTFQEQLDFLRQKISLPTNTSADIIRAGHDRAFVIAGVTSDKMLAEFRDDLDKAIANGGTLESFRNDFDKIVAANGWTYKGDRRWRSRIIFDTNIRTSYQAGRLKQMRDPAATKMRPYWQYVHGELREPIRPRPRHKGWDGMVLRHDDPFWDTHYPPNGWQCSCGVRTLGPRDLARIGKDEPDPSPGVLHKAVEDPLTGDLVKVPDGIDFGWDYAPGATWEQGLVPRNLTTGREPFQQLFARIDPLPPLGDIAKPMTQALVDPIPPTDEAVDRFLKVFDADRDNPRLFRDAAGQAITISRRLFERADGSSKLTSSRIAHLDMLAEALKDPDEIWAAWEWNSAGAVWSIKRRYVRAAKNLAGMIVFEWDAKTWTGRTIFNAESGSKKKRRPNHNNIDAWRVGHLLFRRAKK